MRAINFSVKTEVTLRDKIHEIFEELPHELNFTILPKIELSNIVTSSIKTTDYVLFKQDYKLNKSNSWIKQFLRDSNTNLNYGDVVKENYTGSIFKKTAVYQATKIYLLVFKLIINFEGILNYGRVLKFNQKE